MARQTCVFVLRYIMHCHRDSIAISSHTTASVWVATAAFEGVGRAGEMLRQVRPGSRGHSTVRTVLYPPVTRHKLFLSLTYIHTYCGQTHTHSKWPTHLTGASGKPLQPPTLRASMRANSRATLPIPNRRNARTRCAVLGVLYAAVSTISFPRSILAPLGCLTAFVPVPSSCL